MGEINNWGENIAYNGNNSTSIEDGWVVVVAVGCLGKSQRQQWRYHSFVGEKVLERGNSGEWGQMITCKISGINQDLSWYITTVYTDRGRNERRELWEE